MGAVDKPTPVHADDSISDGLLWPASVADSDILWLEPDPTAPALPATVSPASIVSHGALLPISRLLSADISFEWHDAVALAQQLADQLVPDKSQVPAGSLPGMDAIALQANGRLKVQLDPTGSESIVAGIGKMLTRLLQVKPGPANLRLIGWQAASGLAAGVSLMELTQELARWERPGRLDKLAKLYERAATSGERVADDRPLPLTAPTPPEPRATQEPQEAPEPPAPAAPWGPSQRTAVIAAVVVGVASLAAVLATRVIIRDNFGSEPFVAAGAIVDDIALPGTSAAEGRQEPPTAASAQSARPTVSGRAARPIRNARNAEAALAPLPRQSSLRADRSARTAESLPPASQNDLRPDRSAGVADTGSASPASQNGPRPDRRAGIADVGATLPEPQKGESSTGLLAPVAPEPAPAPQIFASGDDGVVEPVLIKPSLALHPRPGTPEEALGILELVVDTGGMVESVRLRSPANRYRERWWLFAAKDWQFQPARKDGKPVKFLKRIALTDLDISEPQ